MIVAPEPQAVEAGALVLKAGGNAVDAAVTCALVQGVVNPHMCGLGGYALLNAHLPEAANGGGPNAHLLDGPAVAGSKVTPDMWRDALIGLHPDGWGYFLKGKVNDVGYTSVCVPGAVKALAAMLERWGTFTWAQAIQPAAALAEAGFVVNRRLAQEWQEPPAYPEESSLFDYVLSSAEARRIYLKDGRAYQAGERIRNPDYARSLRRLAEAGPEDFYTGSLAADMAADLEANGAHVTGQDLASYRLREEPPPLGSYRGYTLTTSQAPHGGPTLIAALNILEGYDLAALGHNSPEYIYRVGMSMKAAFVDRNRYLADPAHVEVPLDWMLSKERAAEWRGRIDGGEPVEAPAEASTPRDTTHVTVVDGRGNCVALTHSLGASSGAITPGLGFMYNNSMINFHPLPGHPNSIAPRKGRTTGMAPTIVYRDGRPVLVLGAPGASRIITAILQVIVNVLDFGMSLEAAVLAPRFDCQVGPIRCQARIPEYVCAEVRRRHPIERVPRSHGGFALVHGIAIDPESGRLTGAADTGADGMALEV
jgi:gamma-glutamyltranspeptidase/glutathione hydrolase